MNYDYYPYEDKTGPDEHPDTGSADTLQPAAKPQELYTDATYYTQGQAPMPPRTFCTTREMRPRKRRRISLSGAVVMCLCCLLIGAVAMLGMGLAGWFDGADGGPSGADPVLNDPVSTPRAPLSIAAGTGGVIPAGDLYDMACEQVVGISTEVTYTNVFGMTASGAVTGSGFILTEDGYILTNHHVIEYAISSNYKVTVMLYDGSEYEAAIVGYEKNNSDIAVLKIDAMGLNPVKLGDSDAMRVGDTVYAVGNPLGELAYSMTRGMVSALDRDITSQDSNTRETKTINMFQFDAAVNSGNSGGPAYNDQGEVIGVVTAKFGSSGVEGLGFAIPIADAMAIANDLMEKGYVSGRPALGIRVQTITSSEAAYYQAVEGAYVLMLTNGGAADKAGLQLGDIITKLDDAAVTDAASLKSALNDHRAGDTVTITVFRRGEYFDIPVVLDEDAPEQSVQPKGSDSAGVPAFPGGR